MNAFKSFWERLTRLLSSSPVESIALFLCRIIVFNKILRNYQPYHR